MVNTDSRLVAFVALLLVVVSGIAWCQTAEDPMGYHDGSAYLSFSWRSPSGSLGPKGLFVMDIGPAAHVSRWLVAYPERDWRLILTETLVPHRGLATTEIEDDGTGWWVRLETRFEIQQETLGAFFLRSRDLPPIDESSGFHDYRLTTSGGLVFEPRIPIRESATWDAFFDQLASSDAGPALAASVPDSFRAPVLFFDASLMDWSSALSSEVADRPRGWPGLLGLLARVVRTSLSEDDPRIAELAVPWLMEREGPSGKGASIVEPELLELVSHFRSIDNSDPLAGHRVDDLTAPSSDP